jgi:hypothetical protein
MTLDGLLSGMNACVETTIIPEKRRPSSSIRNCGRNLIHAGRRLPAGAELAPALPLRIVTSELPSVISEWPCLATLKQYAKLTEDDIKVLVMDDKWQATVTSRIASEVDLLAVTLVGRIQELGERYAHTVSALDASLAELESKVTSHLASMGIK